MIFCKYASDSREKVNEVEFLWVYVTDWRKHLKENASRFPQGCCVFFLPFYHVTLMKLLCSKQTEGELFSHPLQKFDTCKSHSCKFLKFSNDKNWFHLFHLARKEFSGFFLGRIGVGPSQIICERKCQFACTLPLKVLSISWNCDCICLNGNILHL